MRSASEGQGPSQEDVFGSPEHGFAAEEYWQCLRPRLGDFGITRVADITGLDRLGLPVVQACRPEARSNAVTQGKGPSLAGAAIGAVLESIEMAAGEEFAPELLWPGSVREEDISAWRCLADCPGWPSAGEPWLRGRDMVRGGEAPVPAAILSTDFTIGAAAAAAPILRSSVGNGAGPTPAAAAWHGVLECIESDARIRFQAGERGTGSGRIHLASVTDPALGGLLDRLLAAGLRIGAWEMTMRPGPRAVAVRIMEDPSGTPDLPLPAEGFACRPRLAEALVAALREAVQARLAVIAGSREDMTEALYRHSVPAEVLARDWEALAPGHGFLPAPDRALPGTAADLAAMLAGQGLGPVIAVPLLCRRDIPLHVVRICAPRLLADPERAGDGR